MQSHVPELAGELAGQLCARAGGRLRKAYFASSGSEAIEAAIRYVEANPCKEGKPRQHWSFVTRFGGIDKAGWVTYP